MYKPELYILIVERFGEIELAVGGNTFNYKWGLKEMGLEWDPIERFWAHYRSFKVEETDNIIARLNSIRQAVGQYDRYYGVICDRTVLGLFRSMVARWLPRRATSATWFINNYSQYSFNFIGCVKKQKLSLLILERSGQVRLAVNSPTFFYNRHLRRYGLHWDTKEQLWMINNRFKVYDLKHMLFVLKKLRTFIFRLNFSHDIECDGYVILLFKDRLRKIPSESNLKWFIDNYRKYHIGRLPKHGERHE